MVFCLLNAPLYLNRYFPHSNLIAFHFSEALSINKKRVSKNENRSSLCSISIEMKDLFLIDVSRGVDIGL